MCDHCVVLLLDDLERAGALLPAIREQLSGINASSVAWARLHRLNASITDLQVLPCLTPRHPLPARSLPILGHRLTFFSPRASFGAPQAPIMRPYSSWRHWNNRPQASGRTLSIWMARQAPGDSCLRTPWNIPPPEKPPLTLSQTFPEKSLSSGPKPSKVTPDLQLRLKVPPRAPGFPQPAGAEA